MINSFEDLDIEFLRRLRVERHTKCHKSIRQALDTAVAHVGSTGLRDGVVVDVNDTVEVVCHDLGDIV